MAQKIKNLLEKIYYWAPTWGSLIPIQLFAIYSVFVIFNVGISTTQVICFLIGFFAYNVLGISICYHRLLSHGSFKTTRPRKIFLLVCATLAGQFSPLFWTAIHRGVHHRTADTEKDLHSPLHGFWHSYFLWMYKIKHNSISPKVVPDLLRDRDVRFFHEYYMLIYWGLNATILILGGFNIWLFLVALPSALTFHSYAMNTSLNHISWLGYRNTETKDNSVNVWWIWPLNLGECWHNNHHAMPRNPKFGLKKYEIDPNYFIIKLLEIKESET